MPHLPKTIGDKDDPCQFEMKNLTVNLISESEYLPKGHGVHTAFINMIEMLKRKKVRVLVNSRQKVDVTHIHSIGPFALYKLLTSKPTVVSAHIVPATDFPGSLIGAKHWLGLSEEYVRFFYNKASLVLAVSPKVKADLEAMEVIVPIEVMPNQVDTNLFYPDKSKREGVRKMLGFKGDDFVALSVGQIMPRKGLATFLKVAAALPEIKFLWVGSRPFKKLMATESEINKLLVKKPKNFHLFDAGKVPYKEMPGFYNAADIFFFASHQENFAIVVIEAAATSLPLLLRDLPVYEIFQGHYIAGSEENFAESIKRLKEDKDFYSKWSKKAENLSKKFNFDSLSDKLIGYYKRLLG